jgi:hypothetical protein
MQQENKRQRTFAHAASVEFFSPDEERVARARAAVATLEAPEDQAVAATQQEMISHILENQQEDLQYFKAVYATCGFNLNDDVFVKAEFWNARKSPVLKPANWQHKDKDILGVIYAVEAQYLDGTPIDMESEKVPEDDFELVVHGVVYKYTFAEYAEEIEKRSKAGDLYVSMETWFSDYAYALLTDDTIDVVERTDATVDLDKSLRCLGGTGQYNGKRIGRVLKGLTFGGMGFVDQPANPRSDGLVFASEDTEIEPQITNKMEKIMHDENKVRDAVAAELDQRAEAKRVEALEADKATLESDKAVAAENAERAAKKAEEAELALALIGEQLDSAIAGLGDNPPAEIAKIDNAAEGEEFAAKIAFLGETAKASSDEAVLAELEELRKFKADVEAEKAEAAKAELAEARKADVQEILGEDADEESVEKILAGLIDLDDEAYAERVETLKIVAGKSRPTVDSDGGQGSVEEEGASGESKVASAPREDRKINVAASLEDAEVEAAVEPTGGDEQIESPFAGLDSLVNKNKE